MKITSWKIVKWILMSSKLNCECLKIPKKSSLSPTCVWYFGFGRQFHQIVLPILQYTNMFLVKISEFNFTFSLIVFWLRIARRYNYLRFYFGLKWLHVRKKLYIYNVITVTLNFQDMILRLIFIHSKFNFLYFWFHMFILAINIHVLTKFN